jgi:hypothetical protein
MAGASSEAREACAVERVVEGVSSKCWVCSVSSSWFQIGVWSLEGGEGKGWDERELMIRQSLSAGSH